MKTITICILLCASITYGCAYGVEKGSEQDNQHSTKQDNEVLLMYDGNDGGAICYTAFTYCKVPGQPSIKSQECDNQLPQFETLGLPGKVSCDYPGYSNGACVYGYERTDCK